jgi:Ca2+-binding EF-hand superfamily protein
MAFDSDSKEIDLLNENQMSPAHLFKMFDKDQSGYIDFHEFTEMCKYLGLFLTREKRIKLFSEADQRNNGQIDFDGKLTHLIFYSL